MSLERGKVMVPDWRMWLMVHLVTALFTFPNTRTSIVEGNEAKGSKQMYAEQRNVSLPRE